MREAERDWSPFRLTPAGERSLPARGISSREGVADRLRTAAFAELQAREAFLWAAVRYADAPRELREAWTTLAAEEDRHLGWLMARLAALGAAVDGRPVSARLWTSLTACATARDFSILIASAEERGRQAGELFRGELSAFDPVSADIFGRIADEEVAHIALAKRYFPLEASIR